MDMSLKLSFIFAIFAYLFESIYSLDQCSYYRCGELTKPNCIQRSIQENNTWTNYTLKECGDAKQWCPVNSLQPGLNVTADCTKYPDEDPQS